MKNVKQIIQTPWRVISTGYFDGRRNFTFVRVSLQQPNSLSENLYNTMLSPYGLSILDEDKI